MGLGWEKRLKGEKLSNVIDQEKVIKGFSKKIEDFIVF